jgi:hypothetical protein
MLIANHWLKSFEYPYPAVSLPNLDPAVIGFRPRCCNGLFIGIAYDIDGVGDSVLVVEKIETAAHFSFLFRRCNTYEVP